MAVFSSELVQVSIFFILICYYPFCISSRKSMSITMNSMFKFIVTVTNKELKTSQGINKYHEIEKSMCSILDNIAGY